MKKILVVDDEPELKGQLKWAASGEDREVMSAESAEEAIQLIKENVFDVVVTDLKMKTDYAGLDVLRAAKEKDIYTQVIVVTAYGTPEVSVQTMRLGAFDYLERNAPGTDTLDMVARKIELALQFREAKTRGSCQNGWN